MIAFRQEIREGQSGRDVIATKDAMVRMHVGGSGGMVLHGNHADFAGESWAKCIRRVQKNHSLHQTGVYDQKTHEIIAPHFSPYDRWRYRTAKLRKPKHPPVPENAQAAAKRLIELHKAGRYRDDRGGSELVQIEAVAAGKGVWSPLYGRYIALDGRILEALVWLVQDAGFKQIGTFAMCADHGADTPLGHSGGHCVDISSVDGVSIIAPVTSSKPKVLALLRTLHNAPAHLRPWQLISGGCANILQPECEALCIPDAAVFGGVTLSEHCNHAHLGYE